MLPQPSDGFAWTQVSGRPALVCRALEPLAAHFFATREWRLGSAAARDPEPGWAEAAAAAGTPSALVRLRQVHGASVVVRRAGAEAGAGVPEADIIVSDDPRLALAIQTADCVPLLLADRASGVVAAAHAGWRGLAAGVPRTAVEALRREFGSEPGDLVAAIGPSIGACCYEVGADVRAAFHDGGFDSAMAGWFHDVPQPSPLNPSMPALPASRRANHWFFDGWAAATHQLRHAGVPATQIHAARLCTASHDAFCSYRRDAQAAGRMAAVIRARPRPSPC
jgi:YfiH family protein